MSSRRISRVWPRRSRQSLRKRSSLFAVGDGIQLKEWCGKVPAGEWANPNKAYEGRVRGRYMGAASNTHQGGFIASRTILSSSGPQIASGPRARCHQYASAALCYFRGTVQDRTTSFPSAHTSSDSPRRTAKSSPLIGFFSEASFSPTLPPSLSFSTQAAPQDFDRNIRTRTRRMKTSYNLRLALNPHFLPSIIVSE